MIFPSREFVSSVGWIRFPCSVMFIGYKVVAVGTTKLKATAGATGESSVYSPLLLETLLHFGTECNQLGLMWRSFGGTIPRHVESRKS